MGPGGIIPDPDPKSRNDAIRAEYADEEAEATETEIAEHSAALDIPLNRR